jgi:tetratricopeptide (TPR) repeat protein
MRRPCFSSRLLVAVAMIALSGCVYYNGMYRANRLANSARKAERDGRTFEANNLWGQVATKAESVLVRHPTSKYAEQAELLRGVALARLGQCEQALGPLSRLATTSRSPGDLIEDALLASGRCQMAAGNLPAGDAAFAQLIESKDPDRKREARFQHARVLRQAGEYGEALKALAGIHEPRAESERVLALAGAGRISESLALTDSLIAHGDTTRRWDSVLVIMGDVNPVAASGLVDRMQRVRRRPPELQARTLLEDGQRLSAVDTAMAARRFRQVLRVSGTGDAAVQAGLALLKMRLAGLSDPRELPAVLDSLKKFGIKSESASEEIASLAANVSEVDTAANLVTPQTPQGDIRVFLAAEAAREILKAPRLAEKLFRRIPEQWPFSSYAPKAILAAQQLNPAWADSARALLDLQYYDSPYVATVQGEATPEYRQLEDSLGAFAATLAVNRPVPGARRRPTPAQPGRRPEPVSGGSRVPEPQ